MQIYIILGIIVTAIFTIKFGETPAGKKYPAEHFFTLVALWPIAVFAILFISKKDMNAE